MPSGWQKRDICGKAATWRAARTKFATKVSVGEQDADEKEKGVVNGNDIGYSAMSGNSHDKRSEISQLTIHLALSSLMSVRANA